MSNSDNIIIVISGVIVVLLQLLMAPFLNLFGATPNFIFTLIVAVCIVFCEKTHYVLAFLLGAFYDFSQGSAIGAWMLLLVILAVLLKGFAQNIDSGNPISQLILGIVACILINVAHMLILILTTPALSLSALISSGVLWSFLLDSVAFVLFYVIFRIISMKFAGRPEFGGYIK